MIAPGLTKARMDLLREVDRGDVWTMAGTGRAWLRSANDREVSGRINWLRHAGLVEVDPEDANYDVQGFRLTDAGRAALAEAA